MIIQRKVSELIRKIQDKKKIVLCKENKIKWLKKEKKIKHWK